MESLWQKKSGSIPGILEVLQEKRFELILSTLSNSLFNDKARERPTHVTQPCLRKIPFKALPPPQGNARMQALSSFHPFTDETMQT